MVIDRHRRDATAPGREGLDDATRAGMTASQDAAATQAGSSAASGSTESPGAVVLSKLGHELRAPLAAVLGVSKVMRSKLDNGSADPAQQRRHLELIQASTTQMLEIVDRVVAIANLDTATNTPPSRFDCRTTVSHVADGARARADAHHRCLIVDLPEQPTPADGDENALERLLTELVDNAIKYSDHPQIRIALRLAPGRPVLIEISDDGPGMSTDELNTVFAPFRRGTAADRGAIPGSGLGLYLARQLADRSGIGLDVHSSPGAGTTFTIHPGA
ncbi:sensor histidine kinase [Actinoplanes aureus]|uniref:histidine kinase n=1 Tax=Actinoplanes aureus TaxID=2792083 RepID=A0A931CGZ9_9ACTN|nr:HAMP domain-containing sensor histidine kinase [Actinoplanes aureus]MBG0568459.1 HAMP domain-containing histidine kinase [Actinoplanes aureus]